MTTITRVWEIAANLTLDEVCYSIESDTGRVCETCGGVALVDVTDMCEDCYVNDCDDAFQTWWEYSRCGDCAWYEGARWSDTDNEGLAGLCQDCAYDG